MDSFKIVSWNTAKRLKRIDNQIECILKLKADVVALQEIIPSTEKIFKECLKSLYPYQVSSFELTEDVSILIKKRSFGELLLSKFPISPQDPQLVNVPWTERILSAKLNLGHISILVHTTHIPPGSSNGWIKIEMINGIVDHLIKNKQKLPQLLCGDFNTPKFESKEAGVVTFGQRLDSSGNPRINSNGLDWDASERSLFEELCKHGILETFRQVHPNDYSSYSWKFIRKNKIFKRRFDHIFASDTLKAIQCKYPQIPSGLSDHFPIFAEFSV